jgi:DNA-binding transcriptional LysR family regulator
LQYAQGILRQIDEMEMQYKQGRTKKLCFSVSVPQASYVSAAFSEFIHALEATPVEIFYREASLSQTVDNVLNNDYRLGIIRYPVSEDGEYEALLADKGLSYEMVAEFPYVLVMHREHPLAERADISTEDLLPYIEIVQADPAVTAPLLIKGERSDRSDLPSRRIFALDCGSPLELLSNNSLAFLRSSPLADTLLERYGLIQHRCRGMETLYKDVLIYRESYRLTKLDKQFLTALCEEKRRSMRF